MTNQDERDMHALAYQLADLTRRPGWEATRYVQIEQVMRQLATFCPTCECQAVAKPPAK